MPPLCLLAASNHLTRGRDFAFREKIFNGLKFLSRTRIVVANMTTPTDLEIQSALGALLTARNGGARNDHQGGLLIHALLQMAKLRHRQGNLLRAASLVNEAKERLGLFNRPAPVLGRQIYQTLAELQRSQGHDVEAFDSLERALSFASQASLAPADMTSLYAGLAQCSERLGDTVHAAEYAWLAGLGESTPEFDRNGSNVDWQVTQHTRPTADISEVALSA